jgi:hypothetical protein
MFPSNPALRNWVQSQRVQYKCVQDGQRTLLTSERLRLLEGVGFVWNVDTYNRHIPQTHEEIWNLRLKELHEYKRNFGDCLVPIVFPSNPALGHWVNRQRAEYKCLQDGQRTFLTSERLRLLEGVGFVWNLNSYNWNRKLQELELFFKMKGHTTVPAVGKYSSLSQWTRRQRSEYKKYLNEERTQMDGERVLLLRNVGLQLDVME